MRITVLVTEEEYAKIKKAAGLIPLSAYAKAAMMEKIAADGSGYNPDVLNKNFRKMSSLLKKGNGGK